MLFKWQNKESGPSQCSNLQGKWTGINRGLRAHCCSRPLSTFIHVNKESPGKHQWLFGSIQYAASTTCLAFRNEHILWFCAFPFILLTYLKMCCIQCRLFCWLPPHSSISYILFQSLALWKRQVKLQASAGDLLKSGPFHLPVSNTAN